MSTPVPLVFIQGDTEPALPRHWVRIDCVERFACVPDARGVQVVAYMASDPGYGATLHHAPDLAAAEAWLVERFMRIGNAMAGQIDWTEGDD